MSTADLKDCRFSLANLGGPPARHRPKSPLRAHLLPAESIQHEMSHFNTRGDKNLTWDQIKGTFLVGIVGLFLLPSWELLACNLRNWERKRQNSAAREQPYPPAVSKADTLPWILKSSSIFSSLHLEAARVSPFHQKKAVASGWTGSWGVMLSLRSFCPQMTLSCLR